MKCRHCGEEYSEKVVRVHEEWCKDRQQETQEEDSELPDNLNETTVRKARELIPEVEDEEVLLNWLAVESENQNRVSIIELLESALDD